MKAYELSFDDIWEWIKNDDNIDLTSVQARAVYYFWENLAQARGREEARFDPSLFFWWREADDVSGISLRRSYIVGYEDLNGKKHYLYSDKRNYTLPF